VPLVALLAVLDGHKTSRAEKIFFVKKWPYGKYGLSTGPESGPIFSIVVPKFTPRKNDRKGVLNTGAYNFDDIWAFGGPDLVKNGQKSAI
jgi:hypothetical protein